jgi:hypothetical protein
MKTARFVFLMLASAAWLFGASYADQSRGQPLRKPERSGRVKLANPVLRKPLPSARRPSAAVRKFRQYADGSFPATRNGPIQIAPTGRTRPGRPPSPVRAAAAPPSKIRHRSPNPAVITGSVSLSRNTGGIDGAQVHRRL